MASHQPDNDDLEAFMTPRTFGATAATLAGQETPYQKARAKSLVVAHPPRTKWGACVGDSLIILGCCMLGALAATALAFNVLQLDIQNDLGLSGGFMNAMASSGLTGLNLFFIPGAIMDRFGAAATGVFAAVVGGVAYLAMSFCQTSSVSFLMLICFVIAGLGGGAAWNAAIGTSIAISKTGGGLGVALVTSSNAVSVALTVAIVSNYAKIFDCTEAGCWPQYVRALAVIVAAAQLVGGLLLLLYRKSNYHHDRHAEAGPGSEEASGDDLGVGGGGAMGAADRARTGSASDDRSLVINHGDGDESSDADDVGLLHGGGEPSASTPLVPFSTQIHRRLSVGRSLVIFRHRYFVMLFFAAFLGYSGAVCVLSQAHDLWADFTRNLDGVSDDGDWILEAFSYTDVVGAFTVAIVVDYLIARKLMKPAVVVGIVYVAVGALLVAVGVVSLVTKGAPSPGLRWFGFCVYASTAIPFGVMLTLFPVVVEEVYGPQNFGKLYGLVNLAPTITSLVTPLLTGWLYRTLGSYTAVVFGLGVLTLVAGALLILVKNTTRLPKSIADFDAAAPADSAGHKA